nr:polyprenyl synthetase family protein [Bifidobacterium pullorum]
MGRMSMDREPIETRIAALVAEFAGAPGRREAPGCCQALVDAAARQAVASSEGGKRLRALLALDAYGVFAGDVPSPARDAMLDLACGIEVFQTAALVHDDIIDDSDMRRGRPSAHRALATAAHDDAVGTGLGIMLGDVLATASVAIVDRAARGLPNRDALVGAFLGMHHEVEYGQMLDLAVETAGLDDPGHLAAASLDVFRWKTASYTTIAPLELAMLAAGTHPGPARERALAVGHPLGVAFQLADDLLDVIGSSRATGKPVGGDVREGKRTVLLADALREAGPDGRAELIAAYAAPERDAATVRRVIDLFASTGAIDRSRERIAGLWRQARQAIDALGLTPDAAAALADACSRFVPADLR